LTQLVRIPFRPTSLFSLFLANLPWNSLLLSPLSRQLTHTSSQNTYFQDSSPSRLDRRRKQAPW
jgi:hypothetical protein